MVLVESGLVVDVIVIVPEPVAEVVSVFVVAALCVVDSVVVPSIVCGKVCVSVIGKGPVFVKVRSVVLWKVTV